jgi:hypothetical protein
MSSLLEKNITQVDQRSARMAAEISRLKKTGTCKKMLFIVGKGHITKYYEHEKSVVEYLNAEGVRSYAVNMMATEGDGFRWYSCEQAPETPTDVTGFIAPASEFGMQLDDDHPTTNFSDFQMTLVYPDIPLDSNSRQNQ